MLFTGEVIKPDTFKSIREEGMPTHGRPFQKGNMYVHFVVVFPDTITVQQVRSRILLSGGGLGVVQKYRITG